MLIQKTKLSLATMMIVALFGLGCLVSGTFVIIEDIVFDFTSDSGFYWYPVDLTTTSTWQDHKDDIDFIDIIGFTFMIENTSDVSQTFEARFVMAEGEADPFGLWPPGIPTNATTVISGLTVPAMSSRNVTYQESLGMISNLDAFKAIVKTGRFDYYGTSTGGSDNDLMVVTNGKIIVTVSASGAGS